MMPRIEATADSAAVPSDGLERFAENFPTIVSAEGGIARLRTAIKRAAARGKLSSGSSEWPEVSLASLVRTKSGNSKLIKGRLHECPGPGRYPGFSAAGSDVWLDSWEHEGEAVILSAVGARCGKAFLARGKWSAIANTHIVWPSERLCIEFALLLFNDEGFWVRSGGAQPFIKVSATLDRYFRLPTVAEQRRIVATVDHLMALCDGLEAAQTTRREVGKRLARSALTTLSLAELPEDFDTAWTTVARNFERLANSASLVPDLRLAVLELAIRGRLVPQEDSDENSTALRSRLMRKYGQVRGRVHVEEELARPYPLPRGWCWARLPELGEFGRGKSKHRPRNDPALFANGKFPLIQTGDVARANGVVTTYTALYGDAGLAQSRLWPKGTLCITIAANIADSAILGFDACFPDSVVGLVPDPEIGDARYFEYFIRTAKRHVEDFAPSTAQKNINLEILSSIAVPLPPKEEIGRITTKVEQLLTLCDELESRLRARDAQAERLTEALVAEALVP
jgi:restriction endonuclease S subunit